MSEAGSTDTTELARLALLGVNAWVVALLVPSLHVGLDALGALATTAPLAVLAVAVAALPRHRSRARWMLLAAYPAAIGGVIALRRELTERDTHGVLGLALAALSLLAFVAAAAHACSRERRHRPVHHRMPLGRQAVAEPSSRTWTRRALLGVAAVGALALTLVAPALATRRERVERWGEAADDATVFTVVVAATVACVAAGAVVGPALRAARTSRDGPRRSRRRLAAAMLIAVMACVGYLVLLHFDRAAP